MGIFDDLGLKFGINLHYFAIYACISPITLGFGFVELWLQINMIRAKFLG